MDPVDVLPVAFFLLLGAGEVLGGRHPVAQLRGHRRVISRRLKENLESVAAQDVEAHRFVSGKALEKPKHLLPRILQVAPGDVGGIDQQHRDVAFGCGWALLEHRVGLPVGIDGLRLGSGWICCLR